MEWLSETPGSIPHRTTATLLLLQPRAKRPDQGRAACAASFANLPTGGSTDGGVRSIGQHAAGPGGGPGESTCHAWPGMPLISPRRSSHWPSADDQQKSGKLCSALLGDGVVKCFSLPTWASLISGLFQSTANPRENVLGENMRIQSHCNFP